MRRSLSLQHRLRHARHRGRARGEEALHLARFVMWQTGALAAPIIKRETQTFNYARTYSANGPMTSGYGLGFMISRRGDLVALGHGGSTAGFRASVLFHPPTSTGAVVLRSAEGGSFDAGATALRILQRVAATQKR